MASTVEHSPASSRSTMNSSTVHSLGWGHGLRLNKVANPDATPDRKKKKHGDERCTTKEEGPKKNLLCRTVNDRLCSNLKPKPYLEAFHQPTLAPKPGTNLCIASCCDRKTCVHLRRTFCIIPMRRIISSLRSCWSSSNLSATAS